MRELIIQRIEELRVNNSSYFKQRTYYGKPLSDYDIYTIKDELLVGVFEQMIRINYLQR